MKERPILMSIENVKATLEGRKTKTRRTKRLNLINQEPDKWAYIGKAGDAFRFEHLGYIVDIKCPYGQVGDRLWVREALEKSNVGIPTRYAADACPVFRDGETPDLWAFKKPFLSSIHMPRWASRITLEITEIRVERVQEINEEDAIAEGITIIAGTHQSISPNAKTGKLELIGKPEAYTARYHFQTLWDLLNAKRGYPWESNPWVWVITFKKEELCTVGKIDLGTG